MFGKERPAPKTDRKRNFKLNVKEGRLTSVQKKLGSAGRVYLYMGMESLIPGARR